jgi:hypothetical protein
MGGITLLVVLAMVLAAVYGATGLLVLRDKLRPNHPYAPKPLKHPPFWFFPIWLLLAAFGMIVWLIVYGPVIAWRRIAARE